MNQRFVCAWRVYLLMRIRNDLGRDDITLSGIRRAMTQLNVPFNVFMVLCGQNWVSAARRDMRISETARQVEEAEQLRLRKRRRAAVHAHHEALADAMEDETYVQSVLAEWQTKYARRAPRITMLNTRCGRIVR